MHVWTQQQTLDNDETDPSREDKDQWYWETILVDQPSIWIDEIQNFESNRKLYVFLLPTIWKLARIKNITGISKVKLTNSDVKLDRVDKVRVLVSKNEQQKWLWRLIGLKLQPNVLSNTETDWKNIWSIPMDS